MKIKFGSSPFDDDGTFLRTLMLFALLIILLVFIFGPPTSSITKVNTTQTTAKAIFMPSQAPLLKMVTKPKALYITEQAGYPPVIENTPMPTPTPAGGGILRKIAFASNRGNGRHYQLYMMDANGRTVEQLHESKFFDRDPHFSYNGTELAFSSNRSGTYQIYILDLKTRAVKQITRGGADKTNPFWSPNDSQILFTLHKDESAELGMMNADGSKPRQLTRAFGHSHGYGFSPNGRWVSFESTMNNRSEIFIYDLLEKKSRALIKNDDLTYQGDPVFSPLGNKLVFSCNSLEKKTRQLYMYDLAWRKYYRITDDQMDKDDPLFSPDGSKIAYVARWENAWNIFIMDTDGKHVRNVTKSYYDNVVPSWR
ncbi:DPP IV N-terminal domain-containing protein [bacterium]|nr:DPP IV N-terminal domain-containing protein [bacterium]